MDTPDKKIQPSPSVFSKFEDSPVFNYLSTLSPIKQDNLVHTGQSFHLFNFASPPSSLTSPLSTCLNKSKITRAILLPDEPKNNSSENDIEVGRSVGTSSAVLSSDVHNEDTGQFSSHGEATLTATDESSKPVIELPNSLKYESGSPENHVPHSDAVKTVTECNASDKEKSSVEFVQNADKEASISFEQETGKQRIQMEQNKETCDWDKFIDEASDILSCGSPIDEKNHEEVDDKCDDSGTISFLATVLQPPNDFTDDIKEMDSVNGMEVPLTRPGIRKAHEESHVQAVKSHAVVAEDVIHYSSTETDGKQQKTTRRRCLVYEMSGTHYRKLLDNSPISKTAASPNTSKEKSLAASKTASNKFSSLPGIGLHLNALAASSKDKIIVKRQTLTCRRQLITTSSSISSVDPPSLDIKPLSSPMAPDNSEQKDDVQTTENAHQSSIFGEGIEFPQSSPKKKRRKPENVGDGDSCKRCNCKRSKCLKLYCECFAAGLYCVDSCNCQECLNKPMHEETVLETRRQIESRNPLAFAPKVIRCSTTPNNGGELKKTPASARHKRGCNCKKSGCLKKYCECFQGGVGCSPSCRCEGCKNTFGQKEGISIFEEAQMLEKRTSSVSLYAENSKTDMEHEDEAPSDLSNQQDQTAFMPMKQSRRPFVFDGLTHRFSLLSNEPGALQPSEIEQTGNLDKSAFNEDLKMEAEDERHESTEVSKGDYLLPTCVKSASPNCKRVSPPHCHDFETSPRWRSCRKLILRSIMSFPSLTPEKKSTDLNEKL